MQWELILAILFAIPVMLVPLALIFDKNISHLCLVSTQTANDNNDPHVEETIT